ncbi:peptide chain release factor N(5)-glutamine methyltransferase [Candidatus Daviesbacteria bacterium]|nr:peptide chain release factor N(5)-glutamine methyltransferase [Candidatus Daviesbacteria bacterium]
MKKGTTLRGEIQRLQGVPKQYQQGWTEWYKLRFKLTPDVLVPRPETELLVDEVLHLSSSNLIGGSNTLVDSRFRGNDLLTILDIGTGAGCIAISIAKSLPEARIIATDISPKALEVAMKNAKFHNVEDQIIFLQSDLLLAFNPRGFHTKPDIIVANLPYIPTARLLLIDPMVSEQEPRVALDGGKDGFEVYRRLFAQMRDKNFFPKYLIAEIDEDQGEIALLEAKKYFPSCSWEVKKDLAKKDRILLIKFSV